MSVSIGWVPYKPKKVNYIDGGSSLHNALENAFGKFDMLLTDKDIPLLQGIAACGYKGANELITAINDFEKVLVKSEW